MLYATPGRRLNIHRDPGSPTFLRNVRGLVGGMLRLTERDFVRAQARRVPVKVSARNLSAGRIKGRLTTAQLREVRRLMERLYELMGNHPEQTDGTLHALTMVIAPLAEHASKKGGRRRRSTPGPT